MRESRHEQLYIKCVVVTVKSVWTWEHPHTRSSQLQSSKFYETSGGKLHRNNRRSLVAKISLLMDIFKTTSRSRSTYIPDRSHCPGEAMIPVFRTHLDFGLQRGESEHHRQSKGCLKYLDNVKWMGGHSRYGSSRGGRNAMNESRLAVRCRRQDRCWHTWEGKIDW